MKTKPIAGDPNRNAPISADEQFAGPLVSSIALGFTMASPLVFLVTAYLWALVIG